MLGGRGVLGGDLHFDGLPGLHRGGGWGDGGPGGERPEQRHAAAGPVGQGPPRWAAEVGGDGWALGGAGPGQPGRFLGGGDGLAGTAGDRGGPQGRAGFAPPFGGDGAGGGMGGDAWAAGGAGWGGGGGASAGALGRGAEWSGF
jgi:hypothetical protein